MSTDGNSRTLLIGRQRADLGRIDECKQASTLSAWSDTLGTEVVVINTCKRWSCRFCGEQKAKKLAMITQEAKPNRLITLTVNPALHKHPRDAFDSTRRELTAMTTTVRRTFGSFEYLRVLEVTKKGWPHYHLVARCPYIDHKWLSNEWDRRTGAPIVDLRQIKESREVYWYVIKYLSKQSHVPWTDRRVTMTKAFATNQHKDERPSLGLLDFRREFGHPAFYFPNKWPDTTWTQIGTLVYARGTPDHWRVPSPPTNQGSAGASPTLP